nr:unnamed protein product [Callosobruchus chinensis]
MDFINVTINSTLLGNDTWYNDTFPLEDPFYESMTEMCITFLLICCALAMCLNTIVVISVYWIRTPLKPNLKISLSLAIADAISSSMTGVLLFTEKIDAIEEMGMLPCIIELIRLTGIVITVLHLLALSLNHYIGILKPLHYNVIVTKRKVTTVIGFLWLLPLLLVLILSTVENHGLLLKNIINNTCNEEIFTTFISRLSYSMLFFLPIVLMIFCYGHILVAVRKQQNKWKKLSRLGSTKSKGKIKASNDKVDKEQARLQGNIKAINTTLLILGSCFVGWLPGLMFFILLCTDCPINGDALKMLNRDYKYEVTIARLVENMLIILKMFANPIIYTIRIKEIKHSTGRMYLTILHVFCRTKTQQNTYELASQSSRKHTVRMNSFRTSATESQVL